MTNNALFDASVIQQVRVEQLKAEEVNQFASFLKDIDKELKKRLLGDELTEFSRTRIEKLLKSVDRSLSEIFRRYYEVLSGHLLDVAEYEAELEALNLQDALPVETDFESVIPAQAQVRSAVFVNPLSIRGPNGGSLLADFIEGWSHTEKKAITGAIRQGYFEGQTNSQILRNIRGTKANNYNDGLLSVTKRHAQAVIRTSVQHAAASAKMETLKANSDIATGYRWISTLDGRTSNICRSLDGRVFDFGKGPVPPIHIACRSTFVVELKDKFSGLKKGRTRASKDGPVSANLSYYDWLKTQSAEFQESVLGKTKGKLFRQGGISAEKFAALNMHKNFKSVTLAELRHQIPNAFKKISKNKPLTKQAQNVKLIDSVQRKAVESWIGKDLYQSLAGSVDNRRIKKQGTEYGLTQAEMISLNHYSGVGYFDYNKHLWGISADKPELADKSVDVLREALKKLPSFEGTTYRRTTLPASVLNEHIPGNVVHYKAFTSSSYGGDVFSGPHRIVIKGQTGKRIGWISQYNEKEREVLFTSPTDFYVESRVTRDDGIIEITVRELVKK